MGLKNFFRNMKSLLTGSRKHTPAPKTTFDFPQPVPGMEIEGVSKEKGRSQHKCKKQIRIAQGNADFYKHYRDLHNDLLLCDGIYPKLEQKSRKVEVVDVADHYLAGTTRKELRRVLRRLWEEGFLPRLINRPGTRGIYGKSQGFWTNKGAFMPTGPAPEKKPHWKYA